MGPGSVPGTATAATCTGRQQDLQKGEKQLQKPVQLQDGRGAAGAHRTSVSRSTQRCAARSWPGTRLRRSWAAGQCGDQQAIGGRPEGGRQPGKVRASRANRGKAGGPQRAAAAAGGRRQAPRRRTRGAGDGGRRHQEVGGQLQVAVVLQGDISRGGTVSTAAKGGGPDHDGCMLPSQGCVQAPP